MNAVQLEIYAVNDRGTYESVVRHIRALRATIDRAAVALAASNAEWHDDPEGDPKGYAEHHAPADRQYTRSMRDEVIRILVKRYLAEITLQESR